MRTSFYRVIGHFRCQLLQLSAKQSRQGSFSVSEVRIGLGLETSIPISFQNGRTGKDREGQAECFFAKQLFFLWYFKYLNGKQSRRTPVLQTSFKTIFSIHARLVKNGNIRIQGLCASHFTESRQIGYFRCQLLQLSAKQNLEKEVFRSQK